MGDIPNELQNLLNEFRAWHRDHGKPKELSEKLGVKWDQLPLTLTPKEVAEILRISTTQVYQFCHGSMYSFPKFQVGNRFLIPRDKLKEWIEGAGINQEEQDAKNDKPCNKKR